MIYLSYENYFLFLGKIKLRKFYDFDSDWKYYHLQIITNGKYKSAQHRAIANANKARLSVATFHDPAKNMKISPAPALVTESFPPRYIQIVYGEYVSSWYSNGPEGKRNIDKIIL